MIAAAPPPATAAPLVDGHGRTLSYLRLSVTDRCNLRCTYCNPGGTCPSLAPEPLSWEDLRWMVHLAATRLGVLALRLTGGEPTVRPGLVPWVASLGDTAPGLKDIALTTNGMMLDRLAAPLAAAGVHRVNISIDSLRADRFLAITRGGHLARVLAGLAAARAHFRQVKVNVVALRDTNIDELDDFIALSDRDDIEVRFIEPMPLGNDKDHWRRVFIAADELRDRIEALGHRLLPRAARSGNGPATTYDVEGTRARVGFISQMSCTKCAGCNKLRLTSDGVLRPCLLSADEVPLQAVIARRDAEGFLLAMRRAFLQRAAEYHLDSAIHHPLGRPMQCLGG